MSGRRVQIVVLCEDLAQYRFAYRSLVKCGWRPDQISQNMSPRGYGSGFTYVLDNYPAEVRANRTRSKERGRLLLIDADKEPRGGREEQLAGRLKEAGMGPRGIQERIALWVPRRQLETWINYLTHGDADEETDYKRENRYTDKDYKVAVRQFVQCLKKQRALSSTVIPSLKNAMVEFGRLKGTRRRMAGAHRSRTRFARSR